MLNRRRLLFGLLSAPVIIKTPGLLMPVRPLPAIDFAPEQHLLLPWHGEYEVFNANESKVVYVWAPAGEKFNSPAGEYGNIKSWTLLGPGKIFRKT